MQKMGQGRDRGPKWGSSNILIPSCPDQDLEVTKSRVPSAPRPLWLRGASRLTATICGRSDAEQEAP